eukprot:g29910.t1
MEPWLAKLEDGSRSLKDRVPLMGNHTSGVDLSFFIVRSLTFYRLHVYFALVPTLLIIYHLFTYPALISFFTLFTQYGVWVRAVPVHCHNKMTALRETVIASTCKGLNLSSAGTSAPKSTFFLSSSSVLSTCKCLNQTSSDGAPDLLRLLCRAPLFAEQVSTFFFKGLR